MQTYRSFIFDNSGKASKLVSEITKGEDGKLFDSANAPNWVIKYLIK